MLTILRRESFSPKIFLWEVLTPEVAQAAQPGQFVIVRVREGCERIPLTIADFDRERGSVTLVVRVIGKSTEEMAAHPAVEPFQDLVGPLGNPTPIEKRAHVVLVGGGIGIAPVFPILRAFHEQGTRTTAIVGFRTGAEVFWQNKFEAFADRLLLMTEDGSAGLTGTTIDGLRQAIADPTVDEVLAIGPIGMMQAAAEATRPQGIRTYASMNPIMIDGIGMCGSCRVTVDGKVLFACVDGPDMDAHKVDFEELKRRTSRFRNEEQAALRRYHEECALKKRGNPEQVCRLGKE